MSSFDDAFNVVVSSEGGYVNDPKDPGGETKFGISKRSYPKVDIKNLTLGQAKAIYKRDYWDKVNGDALPHEVGLIVFDAAVNSGPRIAVEWLQQSVGVVIDGIIGAQTLKAVHAKGTMDCAVELTARRLVFMTHLPTWSHFGLGWSRRVCRLLALV